MHNIRHTEEAKRKMSIAHTGIKMPSLSDEHRRKIGNAHRGKKVSEETRKKISEATKKQLSEKGHPMLGKKHSEESLKRMIASHIGQKAWNKGVPFSDEAKKKMSLAKIGKVGRILSEETKRKISLAALKRPPRSEEWRRKQSEARKGTKRTRKSIEKGLESRRWYKHSEETKEKLSKIKMGKPQFWSRGEKNSNWKGGITPLLEKIRHCFKYRQWRSDIFTRDDYTCQICSKRDGGIIHADHYPKRFADIFHENKIISLEQAIEYEEFWNLNNGRTLCKEYHRKTDTWGMKGKR